ncbi:hypothetical protein DSECCO2_603600 [anaerobic digester metagenome]
MNTPGKSEVTVFLHNNFLIGRINIHCLRIAQKHTRYTFNPEIPIKKAECCIGLGFDYRMKLDYIIIGFSNLCIQVIKHFILDKHLVGVRIINDKTFYRVIDDFAPDPFDLNPAVTGIISHRKHSRANQI